MSTNLYSLIKKIDSLCYRLGYNFDSSSIGKREVEMAQVLSALCAAYEALRKELE